MKISKIIYKVINSPYFYLLFFINVCFLGMQLLKSKPKNNAKDDRHKIVVPNVLDARSVEKLFPSIKINGPLDSIIGHKVSKSIVLRLIKIDCHECMDSILNNTKKLAKHFGKENVVVLVDKSYDEDEYRTFKRLFQYDLSNMYYFKDPVTTFDANKVSYYFYVTPSTNIAQNIYQLHDKEDAGATIKYYQWLDLYNQSNYALNKKLGSSDKSAL